MQLSKILPLDRVPDNLLVHIDSRDAVVWVLDTFVAEVGVPAIAPVMRLPWRLVLTESSDAELQKELERNESPADVLVRRRGFVHVVDLNPSEVLLPPRSLPVYFLNGRGPSATPGLAGMTRRLTMLDSLRRLSPKELVILMGKASSLPTELAQLWDDGLRTTITIVREGDDTASVIEAWQHDRKSPALTAYLTMPAETFCQKLTEQYLAGRAGDRVALRMRDVRGGLRTVDVTGFDNPETPLLANYELLQEEDLRSLLPADLTLAEVQQFFSDVTSSWRPYAADLPWKRDERGWEELHRVLRRMNFEGADAGRIGLVISESGAGATTFIRTMALNAARLGYPALVARAAPFQPKALEIITFMTRVMESQRALRSNGGGDRLYEAPWLLVFDRTHWEGREDELRRFMLEFERSGRPACVLVVTGPLMAWEFYDNRLFFHAAKLTHQVNSEDAERLGAHLNRYLAPHGPTRTIAEWLGFYETTSLQAEKKVTAFWIALSFWVQRQFDMKETVQEWIYQQFKKKVRDPEIKRALLDIAALTSEMHPLPEAMLPPTTDWPVSQKIEDIRKDIPALALVRILRDGDRYWALAHDLIGRYVLTALFYDATERDAAGFKDATDPEHLRFMILRRVSRMRALGLIENRTIAEEFAISVFKIDPDHGHANFAPFWREVLDALDEMPKSLRTTSRTFLHHTAISRRRISKQRDYFPMGTRNRVELLERAVADIRFALENLPATPEDEADLNLYNSLALAYQDLTAEEAEFGAPAERLAELRGLARSATKRAYETSPDNSFVVETYARSLLADARTFAERKAENAIEALNIVYAAMDRDRSGQRRSSLGKLAEAAVEILVEVPVARAGTEPASEVEALVLAIHALAHGVRRFEGMVISDFPKANRLKAAELLAHPLLKGNWQAVRLRYTLKCLDSPKDFRGQLELLQSLKGGGGFSPQMRLELALLLQQCDRHHEASILFRDLRRLWKQGDYFVEVPSRLRWLFLPDGETLRQVNAKVGRSQDQRRIAKVRELQDTEVPFRPAEFGRQEFKPGLEIRGFISFGHNGPFLRPTTAIQN